MGAIELIIWGGAISGVFAIVGWLLADRDRRQGIEIENLYRMTHALKTELSEYKLKIAENHYPKHELDQRFQQLNNTINEGFRSLSSDVKEMTKTMHEHFKEHHTGSQ